VKQKMNILIIEDEYSLADAHNIKNINWYNKNEFFA